MRVHEHTVATILILVPRHTDEPISLRKFRKIIKLNEESPQEVFLPRETVDARNKSIMDAPDEDIREKLKTFPSATCI